MSIAGRMGEATPRDVETVVRYVFRAVKAKTRECVLNERRVDVFKGVHATRALQDAKALSRAVRRCPPVESAEDAAAVMDALVSEGFLVRVRSENNTRFVNSEPGRQWSDDALYAWLWEDSQLLAYAAGLAGVAAIFACFLFPLWPATLRGWVSVLSSWVLWLAVGFMAFLVVASVVRLVVFSASSYLVPPGVWLLPNLWEDCGFFESFWPLAAWERVKEE